MTANLSLRKSKKGKTWNQIWTPYKWQIAVEMKQDGCDFEQIGTALGLSFAQVQSKFSNERYSPRNADAKVEMATRLNERDSLFAKRRSLTAELLGDPLPGRSALDRRDGR